MEDVNYFGTRDHYMFICFKDMVKLTYPILLQELIKNYYDDLKDYLDLDSIKDFDIYNLERISAERLDINPLKYIKKPDCPDETCDLLLKTFNEEMCEIYANSRFSEFGAKLFQIIPQDRIKEVYIYIEEPAYQMIVDCNLYFGDYQNKIKYLHGDFLTAVRGVPHKPTCYVLNNVEYVHQLINGGCIDFSEVILGELGCNYELDETFGLKVKGIDENIMKKHVFKLAVTPVVTLTKKHFTQLDMNEFDDNK